MRPRGYVAVPIGTGVRSVGPGSAGPVLVTSVALGVKVDAAKLINKELKGLAYVSETGWLILEARVKEAIKKATSIMEQAPKEQIPPSFAEAKEKAVAAMRSKLMGEDGDKELTWGIIAVYTCTASCGSGLQVEDGAELGAYREEFTWKQPSL